MHLPRRFALCCLFSFAALGPVRATPPDFGPNVKIFSPSTPLNQIQATVDAIAAEQFDERAAETQRYALLFMPGTYGTPFVPLNFQVGYYTAVAGLGFSPNDVTVNGSINVYNRSNGTALNNIWRSLSNLTINVTNQSFGCKAGEFWAVSQGAPMRRVRVIGLTTLADDCTQPGYASGGFIADSAFGGKLVNGSQRQFLVRNSKLGAPWTNGVWNQVFSGVEGAPAQCFPAQNGCGPYTTLASSPVTREAPFLYVDSGHYKIFVPSLRRSSVGTTWGSGPAAGSSISIDDFFVAKPTDSAQQINSALGQGKNLLFTPGIYNLDHTLEVTHPNTVVLGLGYPTLVPVNGVVAMSVADVKGVKLAGLLFVAGSVNSPVLLQVGTSHAQSDPEDPTLLSDVFFRIGGVTRGGATISLEVNSDNVILDDIWAWRANHGHWVGWTLNPADTGVIVNGDNVTAYGLFVENYQKYEVIWNGNAGTVIFFQNEMPNSPPSQAEWMEAPGVDGWAAFKIANNVTSFKGYGMGSYSFFHMANIYAANAFEVPATLPSSSLNDLLTVFLPGGIGGILNVINGTGGSVTRVNPSTPVTVVGYP